MPNDTVNTSALPSSTTGLRIAVGGDENGRVDQHFGQTETFLIYDVDTAGSRLAERRRIADHAQEGEDRRATIVRMLGDCRMLLVVKVGEAPKKLLAGAGIDATDAYGDQPVETALAAAFAAHAARR